jgi:hypothetical protein
VNEKKRVLNDGPLQRSVSISTLHPVALPAKGVLPTVTDVGLRHSGQACAAARAASDAATSKAMMATA